MTFARIVDGEIDRWGELPSSSHRLDTGEVVYDLAGAGAKWRRATGWFPVAETDPPEVEAGEVAVASVELVDGVPVQRWSVRPMTQAERGRRERRTRLEQASTVLREWADDAATVTVTSTNAVQVLNVVVDRLAVFFDRFADLLDERNEP